MYGESKLITHVLQKQITPRLAGSYRGLLAQALTRTSMRRGWAASALGMSR
jgi:hypothetical protein